MARPEQSAGSPPPEVVEPERQSLLQHSTSGVGDFLSGLVRDGVTRGH